MNSAMTGDGNLGDALPLISSMSLTDRRSFAALVGRQEPAVIEALVRTAAGSGRWDELLLLVPLLREDVRQFVTRSARGLGEGSPLVRLAAAFGDEVAEPRHRATRSLMRRPSFRGR